MEYMQQNPLAHVTINKVTFEGILETNDLLAVEEPLEIQMAYGPPESITKRTISVTMRTPGNDDELALGFLFTEGILTSAGQVAEGSSAHFEENRIVVKLVHDAVPRLQTSERNFYTTSSCGVCGKSSIDAIRTVSIYGNDEDSISVATQVFCGLPASLRNHQALFANTGGLHASALFDLKGNLMILREDVGRHNALDKVIGTALMNKHLPLNNCILLLSGRASFELIQKASMAGIKIVAAMGAPSSLAMQLAEDFGMTLIGFLTKERFNIYTGGQRIRY